MGSSAHVSRHSLTDGSELIVIEDEANCGERLVTAEQTIARRFAAYGIWPHRCVNIFVFENLRPLIEKLGQASKTLGENKESADNTFHGLEHKPMVHAYNPTDLRETSIFVNRGQMKRLGMWDDDEVLEGLLAHEHAHPLSENATTRRARNMRATFQQTVIEQSSAVSGRVLHALEHLAHELCLHAPHEVFANELAIRAGCGSQLFALNRMSLTAGRAGIEVRNALAAHLKAEVEKGGLSKNTATLLLLLASLEAHVRVALEVAAFVRAESHALADALEILLRQETFRHVESEIEAIYRQLCTSYGALTADMREDLLQDWARNTFTPITNVVARYGAHITASFHF